MKAENLVKVTTFLSSREYALANRAIRKEALETMRRHSPLSLLASSNERWLLEIEAIAAA